MRINQQSVKYLGSGMFTTAYRAIDDTSIVYLMVKEDSDIRPKEILSMCADHKHIPVMHKLCEYRARNGTIYDVFQTEYNKTINTSDKAYKIYKALVSIEKKAKAGIVWYKFDWSYAYTVCEYMIELAKNHPDIPESIVNALEIINSWSSAYGSNYMFEFKRSSIAVDSNGDLLLRDIVFFVEK